VCSAQPCQLRNLVCVGGGSPTFAPGGDRVEPSLQGAVDPSRNPSGIRLPATSLPFEVVHRCSLLRSSPGQRGFSQMGHKGLQSSLRLLQGRGRWFEPSSAHRCLRRSEPVRGAGSLVYGTSVRFERRRKGARPGPVEVTSGASAPIFGRADCRRGEKPRPQSWGFSRRLPCPPGGPRTAWRTRPLLARQSHPPRGLLSASLEDYN
jgi:hypothetical protein